MQRNHFNAQEAFEETLEVYMKEQEAAVRQRRLKIAREWEDVETGWSNLEKFMAAVGVKPADRKNSMVRLNVGGTPTDIWRSTLAASRVPTLAALFEGEWDHRLPRDAADRVVVEVSPECFKSIIRTLLVEASQSRDGNTRSLSVCSVTPENESYLSSVIHMLGCQPSITGGSSMLSPSDGTSFIELLRAWCPHPLHGLELLYRASRDGFNTAAFHSRCDSAWSTITLVRVASAKGFDVVGGFSDKAWAPKDSCEGGHDGGYHSQGSFEIGYSSRGVREDGYEYSTGAFIFHLRNGRVSPKTATKWNVSNSDACRSSAIYRDRSRGPCFGRNDVHVSFDGGPGSILMAGGCGSYGSFTSERHHLRGKPIEEVEVFRFTDASEWSPEPPARDCDTPHWHPAAVFGAEDDDIRTFGASIAGAFMRERAALEGAYAELARARARVEAAAQALKTVYGPNVAAGTEDAVVELSVRGTSITTLRSTLLICPDSALAARFNEDRWTPNDTEMDASGKRTVDCDPISFAKVLDVLRLRKRAAWASGARGAAKSTCGGNFHVVVKESDRAGFDELVNMYFPGCESFITDLVKPPAAAGGAV